MTNNSDSPNKKLIIRLLICAIVFVAVFVIANIATVGGVFSALFSVLLPILLGAALAYLLNPILKFYEFKVFKKIQRKGLLRGLSILMTYVTLLLILCAFGAILIPSLIQSIIELTDPSATYFDTTAELINSIVYKFTDDPAHMTLLTGEMLKTTLVKLLSNFLPSSDDAMNIISGVGTVIKNSFLAFFISLYMLISKEKLAAQTRKLTTAIFGTKGRRRLYRYVRIINRNFGGYFSGVLFDALIVMAVSFVCFIVFNIPFAPLVAVIIGTTNIIPIFGPFIGAIPSFVIIFIKSPTKALIFAILILIIQQIDGNIIAPKVLGNSTNISSLGVIIAITVMGSYFGIVGMVVGVPIFAAAIAIGKEFIDNKLRNAELPTDTAEYYADDSLVDPYEQHESFTQRLFRRGEELFCKLFRIKKKQKTKSDDTEATANEADAPEAEEIQKTEEKKEE